MVGLGGAVSSVSGVWGWARQQGISYNLTEQDGPMMNLPKGLLFQYWKVADIFTQPRTFSSSSSSSSSSNFL